MSQKNNIGYFLGHSNFIFFWDIQWVLSIGYPPKITPLFFWDIQMTQQFSLHNHILYTIHRCVIIWDIQMTQPCVKITCLFLQFTELISPLIPSLEIDQ